jgi:predicted alpha/beta-fold hydrolase
MLAWLACRLAPKIPDLTEVPSPDLPDPSPHDSLEARAREAFDALEAVPYSSNLKLSPHKVLMGMGCRDLITREADQHPDTAGRTPNYARFPAFEEVRIPGSDGVMLPGHRSTGAPGAPVIIVTHGLYDSHTSIYLVEYAEVLRRFGFHVVALDLRDHGQLRGNGPPPSLGPAEGRDLFAAACALSDAEGVSVGILGLSYGGHCAVRAAHEATLAGRPEVLRGGVLTLSAPLNIHEAVLALDDHTRLPTAHGFVNRMVMSNLYRNFRRHLAMRVAENAPLPHPCKDYESYVREIVQPAYPDTPPLVGAFLGAARCTQPSVMGELAVPVAMLHASDDMLVPVNHLHEALAAAGDNSMVYGRELAAGGHVGFCVNDAPAVLSMLGAFFGRLRDG